MKLDIEDLFIIIIKLHTYIEKETDRRRLSSLSYRLTLLQKQIEDKIQIISISE
jgi:hypothetical protein